MVISLSSDKTVWDAVLNNEVVKEIRESYLAGWFMLKHKYNTLRGYLVHLKV